MPARIPGATIRTRVSLGRRTFVPGQQLVWPITQDMVVEKFEVVAQGYMACTFAGTKPIINPIGLGQGLYRELYVTRSGTDRVKSFRGIRHIKHTSERQYGQVDGDVYKVNATTLGGATLAGNLTWGTTGQNTAFRHSNSIWMGTRHMAASYPTFFSTQGLQTAQFVINCGEYRDVQEPGNTDANTYSGVIEIEVFALCHDYLLGSNKLVGDFSQNVEEREYNGAQTNSRQFINPQGRLLGMLITGIQNNGAPFDFAHMANTRLEFKYEGISVSEGPLSAYQEIDMSETQLSSRLPGSAYLDLSALRDPRTGLPIRRGTQLEMLVSTDPALSYSSPGVKLVFEYDQILEFEGRSVAEAVAA